MPNRTMVALALLSSLTISASAPAATLLKVGHVGHDHHLALFVAASLGKQLEPRSGGVWFRQLKQREVYELMEGETSVAQVHLRKVGGGSGMPAALARNEIEVGLGGVAPTAAAIDRGASLKIIAPCNTDGDMLMVRPEFPATSWETFLAAVRQRREPVRIGYKAPRAVAYLIFMRALKASGVRYGPKPVDAAGKPVQVVLVNLQKGSHMVPSLQGKVVDGIVMNQPTVAVAEAKGAGKVVADLRDLPPKSKWRDHPCCCVVATDAALKGKREAVRAFVQAVVAGGRFIAEHPDEAIRIASDWTGCAPAVEKRSVPTVTYVDVPGRRWEAGMLTWFEMMNDLNQFTNKLRGLTPKQMYERVSDHSLVTQAAKAVKPLSRP